MLFRYFYWLFIIAIVLFFYVWQQTQSMRLGYTVDNMRRECEKWEQENSAWRLDVNRLLSLERLAEISKQRNLAAPHEKSIIYLSQ